MSEKDTGQKRKKIRTALFLLITVVALYILVIAKQW